MSGTLTTTTTLARSGRLQFDTWNSSYIPNATSVNPLTANSVKSTTEARGTLYGSPIVYGSTDEFYGTNHGVFGHTEKYPFINKVDEQSEFNWFSGTFAGIADGGWGPEVEINFRGQRTLPRKSRITTATFAARVIEHLRDSITNKGPFSDLIPGAPNGFLMSLTRDGGQGVLTSSDLASAHNFNLDTSYPTWMGDMPPWRELYTKFYGDTRDQYIDGWGLGELKDKAGNVIKGGSTIKQNNKISSINSDDPTIKTSINRAQDHSNRAIVTGPISNHSITLGNGNLIFAASPIMTPAVYRKQELAPGVNLSEKLTDTVLYPSSVGAFGTNNLKLGNGNNLVYYDSSFKQIETGTGGSTFIPSFGSFNWSIDWIPAYGTIIDADTNTYYLRGLNGATNKLQTEWLINDKQNGGGRANITPIPWDTDVVIPGKGGIYRNQEERDLGFANPYLFDANAISDAYKNENNSLLRRQIWHNANLYTINSYNQEGYRYQKTYFNGKDLDDKGGDTSRINTYNPVNRLGGVTLKATGGNNIFYGFDPQLWENILPKDGSTTYNQSAGRDSKDNFRRIGQHEWHTVSMYGGRGNNTFFLGNVIDDITNNSIFYKADNGNHSYILSLTHDNYFAAPYDIWSQGVSFGNATDPVTQAPLVSNVFLAITSDKETVKVITQKAEPGDGGGESKSATSAWASAGTAAAKIATNTDKIQQDYTKYANSGKIVDGKPVPVATWISQSTKYARIIGSFVPFVDMAFGAVSAISGLINLFNTKPVKPPKEEISVTYMEAALHPDFKSVLINDWHPGCKINLTLPSTNPDAWGSLNLSIESPNPNSSTGATRDKGVYIQLSKATMRSDSSGKTSTSTDDFALVVLDNFGKKNDAYEFGYYGYNFNTGGPQAFQELDGTNLALFGTLPNPAMMDGKERHELNFPSNYVYRHDGFDMRQDTSNYMAFYQGEGATADPSAAFYSKYYLNDQFTSNEVNPYSNNRWSAYEQLKSWTSNVSIEFDSRSLGYYWQTVVKPIKTPEGKIDAGAMFDPTKQEIDFEQSKLWIRNSTTKEWESYSMNSLSYDTKAYRYSLLANTFYYTTKNGAGEQEIKTRTERDVMLQKLENVIPDLSRLDQSSITDERYKLLMLQQITYLKDNNAVGPQTTKAVQGKSRKGYSIKFGSESATGNQMTVELFVYDNGAGTPTAHFVKATEIAATNATTPVRSTTPRTEVRTTTPIATRNLVTTPQQSLDTPSSLTTQASILANTSPSELNPLLTSNTALNPVNASVPWLNNQSTLTV